MDVLGGPLATKCNSFDQFTLPARQRGDQFCEHFGSGGMRGGQGVVVPFGDGPDTVLFWDWVAGYIC